MFSLKTIDEFIYNNNMDIALKLTSTTVFAGAYPHLPNKYTFFEVWILQSPSCDIRTNTSEFTLHQGDILIFSKEDDSDIIFSNTNVIFLKLVIDADAFIKVMPLNTITDKYNFFFTHSDGFNNKIPASHPTAQKIHEYFSSMIKIFQIKQLGYELEILQICLSVFLTIARETNYSSNSITSLPKKNDIAKTNKSLKHALDYIDSHLTDELTLEKIALVADLSPNYLSNIFREQTGMRLWDYIGEKRIHLATQFLLESPNDSIISVALKCGFNNCPNFNRAFKKYTGQTPMRYKLSVLRQED